MNSVGIELTRKFLGKGFLNNKELVTLHIYTGCLKKFAEFGEQYIVISPFNVDLSGCLTGGTMNAARIVSLKSNHKPNND